jgi:steroid 5-alpha reductase family enzyme
METGYPDPRAQPPWGRKNLVNLALAIVVLVPAVVCCVALYRHFPSGAIPEAPDWRAVGSVDGLVALLLRHPVLTANLFFLVFVDLAFFAIALAQRSSWLIDPYWTLLPPLLAAFYLAHPLAAPEPLRVGLALLPLTVWSVRLTGSYFRRESWRFGLREDWRYAKMRRERPHFRFEQFFVVHLAQHAMLVGLSLPFYAIAFRPVPITLLDGLAFAGALAGIAIAAAADNQLDHFMRANALRERRGEPRDRLLETGLWRLSRHPNYFGEQLFWWSIAGFGVACGEPWVAVGAAFNSCVLAGVTVMTERRMLRLPERAERYEDYRRRTSVWLPWPPRKGS